MMRASVQATFTGVVLWCAISSAQAQNLEGDVTNGKKLYAETGCAECHNAAAQGSILTGPRLANTVLSFPAFLKQLRRPSFNMPPYEAAVLTDQQANDIYAFVSALPKADPQSIPLLTKLPNEVKSNGKK